MWVQTEPRLQDHLFPVPHFQVHPENHPDRLAYQLKISVQQFHCRL